LLDITIIGGGTLVAACAEALTQSGFRLRRTLEIDRRDRSPVIVGELPTTYALARQAVEGHRHVLIAAPGALTSERLEFLLERRRSGQALFVWSERRFHPGYRFVRSLIESDASWRPRYLRHQTYSDEAPASATARWMLLEATSLVLDIAGEAPASVAATCVTNPVRHAPELITLAVHFENVDASIQVALGEAIQRRETLLATADRKAFIDEMNSTMPVRLVEEERGTGRNEARWLTCPAPSPDELARQQCVAFLEATLNGRLADEECELWQNSISLLGAMDRAIAHEATEAVTVESGEQFAPLTADSLIPRAADR
jgi:predicted dehydrogenase